MVLRRGKEKGSEQNQGFVPKDVERLLLNPFIIAERPVFGEVVSAIDGAVGDGIIEAQRKDALIDFYRNERSARISQSFNGPEAA